MSSNMQHLKSATGMSDSSGQGSSMNPATSAGSEHPSRGGQSSINPMSSKTASSSGSHGNPEDNRGMLDRGMEGMENKMGMSGNTEQSRNMNERIGDQSRGMFEKTTGKKMPDQFSR